MKVVVAGTRTVREGVLAAMQSSPFWDQITEVVHGGARGVDQVAGAIASVRWPVRVFPADWAAHGRAAGPIRNRQMAEYADALIAVWDGESRGTASMIAEMRKLGKPVHVVIVKGEA